MLLLILQLVWAQGELRPGTLILAEKYLNEKISEQEMSQQLEHWNQEGWSEQERQLIQDTLGKRPLNHPIRCLFDEAKTCPHQKLKIETWPNSIREYDKLTVGGRTYTPMEWTELRLPLHKQKVVFHSEKRPPLSFYEVPHLIQFPTELPVFPTPPQPQPTRGFYEGNKKTIWWTVGGLFLAGVALSLSHKKIVINTSGF